MSNGDYITLEIKYVGDTFLDYEIFGSLSKEILNLATYFTFNQAFEFDDLEITFGDEIGLDTLKNRFSDLDGETVFYVPITITNLSNETHGLNMFSINQFGPAGVQLDSVSAFFSDNDVSWAENMRAGATQTSRMYFHYTDDGIYVVELGGIIRDKVEVQFEIIR